MRCLHNSLMCSSFSKFIKTHENFKQLPFTIKKLKNFKIKYITHDCFAIKRWIENRNVLFFYLLYIYWHFVDLLCFTHFNIYYRSFAKITIYLFLSAYRNKNSLLQFAIIVFYITCELFLHMNGMFSEIIWFLCKKN